jgi:hypothetical protein
MKIFFLTSKNRKYIKRVLLTSALRALVKDTKTIFTLKMMFFIFLKSQLHTTIVSRPLSTRRAKMHYTSLQEEPKVHQKEKLQ